MIVEKWNDVAIIVFDSCTHFVLDESTVLTVHNQKSIFRKAGVDIQGWSLQWLNRFMERSKDTGILIYFNDGSKYEA